MIMVNVLKLRGGEGTEVLRLQSAVENNNTQMTRISSTSGNIKHGSCFKAVFFKRWYAKTFRIHSFCSIKI
jgi:hypothetical protein